MTVGMVEPGWEEVARAFEENFSKRGEVGAACAVWRGGRFVVDLWGGVRDAATRAPWERDTMVIVYSATKGMAGACFAVAHARGFFRYDDPVARHWPEFAQAGKDRITIRELLSHRAGLAILDERVDARSMADLDGMAAALARQRPFATGGGYAYHAITFGWYAGALLSRVDPKRRSMGRFFQEEIAAPLGVDFHIGTPASVDARLATPIDFGVASAFREPRSVPFRLVGRLLNPFSLASRVFRNPRVGNPSEFSNESFRRVEMPSTNGIGEVRALARVYGELASGGAALGLDRATLDEIESAPVAGRDAVLGIEMRHWLGFSKSCASLRYGSDRAFGTSGLGGSFGFGDPATGVGYAYAPNRLGAHLRDDPRERALREAVLRAVSRA